MTTQKCNSCKISKPLSEFEFRQDRGYHRRSCKVCRADDRIVRQKKYRSTDNFKQQNKDRFRKSIKQMDDNYLKKRICERNDITFNKVTSDMLYFQREILTLNRIINGKQEE